MLQKQSTGILHLQKQIPHSKLPDWKKLLERRLEERQGLNNEKSTFVAMILGTIGGILFALGIEDVQRKEYAKAVENAATRLSKLISNILKMNKLESQRIVPEMEDYDRCRQLCECILQFEDKKEVMDMEGTGRQQNGEKRCGQDPDLAAEDSAADEVKPEACQLATMYAIIVGVIGTAFMAGSVFAVTAQQPHYILCTLLAELGFLG